MLFLKKLLPIFISGIIFGIVIWQIQPPASFIAATPTQFIFFFVPLFFLLISLFNLIFDFYLRSFIFSLGIIIVLVLKALDLSNILTISVTLSAIVLISKSLKKPKKPLYQSRIPKLSKLIKQK